MRIICVVGLIGCGKDTATDYIEKKYGYNTINTGDIVREFAKRENLELTRENLQNIRVKHGNNFVGDVVIQMIRHGKSDRILLNGVRRSEDYEIPKKAFGDVMKMILIETDKKKRFERLHNRRQERDPESEEEFERDEAKEWEIYDFDRTFSYADYRIENNGSQYDLYVKIDKLIEEIERSNIIAKEDKGKKAKIDDAKKWSQAQNPASNESKDNSRSDDSIYEDFQSGKNSEDSSAAEEKAANSKNKKSR